MKFDGRAFANEIEERVAAKVATLPSKPKIVSVLVGDDPASQMYTRLKQKAAERVGIDFEIVRLTSSEGLKETIKQIGERSDVTGLMIQLPIPSPQGQTLRGKELKYILSVIPLNKDVDGLRSGESGVVPATVSAILAIVDRVGAKKGQKYVVVGAQGAVGRPLVTELKRRNEDVIEVGRSTAEPTRMILEGEVVISCVGQVGLITAEMVREGVVAIDVGGDMTKEVYQKASVSVENPGGVGPVTVASLMQNILGLL